MCGIIVIYLWIFFLFTEAPEEEYDSRSLFDRFVINFKQLIWTLLLYINLHYLILFRLKEQKDKKQADWDEAHKLSTIMVLGHRSI